MCVERGLWNLQSRDTHSRVQCGKSPIYFFVPREPRGHQPIGNYFLRSVIVSFNTSSTGAKRYGGHGWRAAGTTGVQVITQWLTEIIRVLPVAGVLLNHRTDYRFWQSRQSTWQSVSSGYMTARIVRVLDSESAHGTTLNRQFTVPLFSRRSILH